MKFTLPLLCIYYKQSEFWIYLEFGEFLVNADAKLYGKNGEVIS